MTLLFHVLLIHRCATPLETIVSYSRITATWILCTQLFHIFISLLHRFTGIHALIVSVFLLHGSLFILHELLLDGYSHIPVTWLFLVTWILCTQLFHVLIPLLHRFTGIHALIVSIFMLHGSLFILHELLLHGYSCIPVTWLFLITWLFPVTDIDIPVTEHVSHWYAMCGTKCHMDPSHGATSRIPHLLFFVSRYLSSCYQQSSCPVIMLHISSIVLVLDTPCSLNIINITWDGGDLTVD